MYSPIVVIKTHKKCTYRIKAQQGTAVALRRRVKAAFSEPCALTVKHRLWSALQVEGSFEHIINERMLKFLGEIQCISQFIFALSIVYGPSSGFI